MRGGNRRGSQGKILRLLFFPPSGIVAGAARMKESPGRKIREGRWESMTIRYQPRGVCARQFEIQAEDGIIQSVQVTGGCSGNLQGISSLLKGMPVQEAIQRMEGIRCGMKSTSCPDQMAQALKQFL